MSQLNHHHGRSRREGKRCKRKEREFVQGVFQKIFFETKFICYRKLILKKSFGKDIVKGSMSLSENLILKSLFQNIFYTV